MAAARKDVQLCILELMNQAQTVVNGNKPVIPAPGDQGLVFDGLDLRGDIPARNGSQLIALEKVRQMLRTTFYVAPSGRLRKSSVMAEGA